MHTLKTTTMKKQRILISNDDGVNAKGLKELIEVALKFGEVTVVAPEQGMSGMSHSITMNQPLYLRKVQETENCRIFACEGTPVDCINLAVDVVMEEMPTIILSGINHGANSNISVIYSGTMGAATEGAAYSVPSIGFSVTTHDEDADFEASKHYAEIIIRSIIENNDNKNLCLNVNIPDIPLSEIKGIKTCRQTKGYWKEDFLRHSNPRGKEYYWFKGKFLNQEPLATDTDEWALDNKYVAIVPVKVDMTDYSQLEKTKNWF